MNETAEIYRKGLAPYLPEGATDTIAEWLQELDLNIVLWNHRKTKLGDFRASRSPFQKSQISINKSLNKYSFLITLTHEISHAVVYRDYGRRVKPHGEEWKREFGNRLRFFLDNDIFPSDIGRELYKVTQNPRATAAGQGNLYKILMKYDSPSQHDNKVFVEDLNPGDIFLYENTRLFELGEKRRTNYFCKDKRNGRTYIISGKALVEKQ